MLDSLLALVLAAPVAAPLQETEVQPSEAVAAKDAIHAGGDARQGGDVLHVEAWPPEGVLTELEWDGNVATIELTADQEVLEGHEYRRVIEYEGPFDTTLFISLMCPETDVRVRVLDLDGEVLVDSTGRGGVHGGAVELLEGDFVEIVVSTAERPVHPLRLKLFEARENERTLELAEKGREVLSASRELRQAGDIGGARSLVDEWTARLEALEGLTRSRAIAEVAWSMSGGADALASLPQLLAARQIARSFRERTLPGDHRAVLEARMSFAVAVKADGDFAGAKALLQLVLEALQRSQPPDHVDIQRVRGNLAGTLKGLGDLQGALALEESVLAAFERSLPAEHPNLQMARANLANTLRVLGDLPRARALQQAALEVNEKTLPVDHPELQRARASLAGTLKTLGDLQGALALEEIALEVYERILPAEHHDLQRLRVNLAVTLEALGRLQEARELVESALRVWLRSLPPDHPDLLGARQNLAATMRKQGELRGALAIEKSVLEVVERTLPADHPGILVARRNLATTLSELGDLKGAHELFSSVLQAVERSHPPEHPELQRARLNVGVSLHRLGDPRGALRLVESAVEESERILPPDHPDLQWARASLAAMLHCRGDLQGARALQELVLEVLERVLPADHPDLLTAQGNLAVTLRELGELRGASAIEESVLEVSERTLPEDHPDILRARCELAISKRELGDLLDARGLLESVLRIREQELPPDHPDLQTTRESLAGVLEALGETQAAKALMELALAVSERRLPSDHRDLQSTRLNYASILKALGEFDEARELEESTLEAWELSLPQDHPSLQSLRLSVSAARTRLGETKAARELVAAVVDGTRVAFQCLNRSSRELEAMVPACRREVSWALSFLAAFEDAALERQLFSLIEEMRGIGARMRRLDRQLARSDRVPTALPELRRELDRLSVDLRGRARRGERRESEDPRALIDLLREKEAAERRLRAVLLPWAEAEGLLTRTDFASIAGALAASEAAIGFWKYSRVRIERSGTEPEEEGADTYRVAPEEGSYVAFVVDSDGTLARRELGASKPIESAVEAWRKAVARDLSRELGGELPEETRLELAAAGTRLRALVFDPLRDALGGRTRLILALDDALHLIPVGALPDDDGRPLSDRFELTRVNSLSERTQSVLPELNEPSLLALGGIDYRRPPEKWNAVVEGDAGRLAVDADLDPRPTPRRSSSSLRKLEFAPLRQAGEESLDIEFLFRERWPDAAEAVLGRQMATKEAFRRIAPRTRFLHLATHGYFEPESIPSTRDPRPLSDHLELFTTDHRQQVRGFLPMELCGLALAGANLELGPHRERPGILSADELADFDLTGCEIAVLSACDTNVGVVRAGQGVASLQQAIYAAGARASITSLWKVPDSATRELMKRFYTGWWLDGKSKAQALRDAQKWMRDQKDPATEEPRYTVKDWAAWVLVGDGS